MFKKLIITVLLSFTGVKAENSCTGYSSKDVSDAISRAIQNSLDAGTLQEVNYNSNKNIIRVLRMNKNICEEYLYRIIQYESDCYVAIDLIKSNIITCP